MMLLWLLINYTLNKKGGTMLLLNVSILLTTLILSGCATIAKGTTQSVDIQTAPPGLIARIDSKQCSTPCTLHEVSRKSEKIAIEINKQEYLYDLDKHFNFWFSICGNIWNEIIPGLVVDIITGASKDIQPVYIAIPHVNIVKNTGDMYTDLKKIKELADAGVLTKEEYDSQKKKIIEKNQ